MDTALAAAPPPARQPAFRFAHLAEPVWTLARTAPGWAENPETRARAVRAALALEEVSRLPSPGLAKIARDGARRIRRALDHAPAADIASGRETAA